MLVVSHLKVEHYVPSISLDECFFYSLFILFLTVFTLISYSNSLTSLKSFKFLKFLYNSLILPSQVSFNIPWSLVIAHKGQKFHNFLHVFEVFSIFWQLADIFLQKKIMPNSTTLLSGLLKRCFFNFSHNFLYSFSTSR